MGTDKKKQKILREIKTILYTATVEWKKLFCSTKICVLGILLIFMNEQIIVPMKECSHLMGQKLSCMEPYAAICNSGVVMLILPLFFLSMMADFPREDGISMFFHIRCSRISWLFGELLFIVMSIITLVIYITVVSMLLILPSSKMSLEFSDTVTKYIASFPERAGDYVVQLLPENLYNQMKLSGVVLHSTGLLFLYFALLALILLLFTLLNHKIWGIFLDGGIILLGTVCCALRLNSMWVFPMAHTVVWLHYSEYLAEPVYPLSASYLYFGIIDILLIAVCIAVRKQYQIRGIL